MQIDDFRTIVESKKSKLLQNTIVSFEEANAVVANYERLNEPYRSKFINMPVSNIIEFVSSLPKKQNGSFKSYIKNIENKTSEFFEQQDRNDQEVDHVEPVPEKVVEEPIREPEQEHVIPEQHVAEVKPIITEIQLAPAQEQFYTKLLEHIENLSEVRQQPVSVTVETTETHIERLVKLEESMLGTLTVMTEHVRDVSHQSGNFQLNLSEVLENQRHMIDQVTESQKRIVETQGSIIQAVSILAEKIGTLLQTPPTVSPIINVPAPVVNVEGSRRFTTTKLVERDKNGLISKVIEDASDDD